MIWLLIRLPLVLAILLPLTWAGVLLHVGEEVPLLGGAVSGLKGAYPAGAERERLLAGAARAPSAFPAGLLSLGGSTRVSSTRDWSPAHFTWGSSSGFFPSPSS